MPLFVGASESYDTDAWEAYNLKKENAKLRELVRDMYKCLEHCKLVCEYCKFQGVDCQWFKFADRMRELGIETGDGVS